MTHRANVDILMTTLNEELNVPYSLPSVVGWARRVFVLDSGSTDRTRVLSEKMGATVVHHGWEGYGRQKNWGLDNLPFESEWVFILDADEVLLPDLKEHIEKIVNRPPEEVKEVAFNINRYFIFLGKRIRHCGYYPSWNIRLLRRGKARYEDREVHEHIIADGPVGWCQGNMEHFDRRGMRPYIEKHNHYSSLEAIEIYKILQKTSRADLKPRLLGDTAERRRWIKRYIYPRLPMKWLARFIHAYFFRLGLLDGLTGLRFCLFLAAYEYMIELKLIELKRNLAPQQQAKQITQSLAEQK